MTNSRKFYIGKSEDLNAALDTIKDFQARFSVLEEITDPTTHQVTERGPFFVVEQPSGDLAIQSDDFTLDAQILVTGDFPPREKAFYLNWLCTVLNVATGHSPTPPGREL